MNDYWMNLEPVKLQIKNWLEQATADGGHHGIKKILSGSRTNVIRSHVVATFSLDKWWHITLTACM